MSQHLGIQPPIDIQVNFWIANAPLLYVEAFKNLYEEFGKERSSKIMWSIWMDKEKGTINSYRNMPQEQKLSAIKKYCVDYDPEDDLIRTATIMLLITFESPAKRAFRTVTEDIINRDYVMAKMTAYVKRTAEENPDLLGSKEILDIIRTLEQMRKNTDQVFKKYKDVEAVFAEEEKVAARVKGGGQLNLIEKGGLLELPEDDDTEEE